MKGHYYYADAGLEWRDEESSRDMELSRVGDLIDSVEADAASALRSGQEARALGTAAALAEIKLLTALAEKYLEGTGWFSLELADVLARQAWSLLTATIRRTRSLRSLIGLGLAARRVTSLRIRIAGHKAATLRIPPARALTPAAGALRSLTRAAHGPPLPGSYRLSATTGGGPL